MQKQQTLKAEARTGTGTGPVRALRREGWVPGVMYGFGAEPRSLKVREKDLGLLLKTLESEHSLIGVSFGGGEDHTVLIREVQHHPIREEILHVDFMRVSADRLLRVGVPVVLTGIPIGVKDFGGILEHFLREVEVECLPGDIPEHIEVNVEELMVGDALHLSDLTVEKVTILGDPSAAICVVARPTIMKEATEAAPEAAAAGAEAPAEPALVEKQRKDKDKEKEK